MRHFTTPEFWQLFNRLPQEIQTLAKKDFELLKENPRHPSLRLKKAGLYWTVRVGIHYRAIAKERAEGLNWFGLATIRNTIASCRNLSHAHRNSPF
jgi:hypothetical protein